MVADWRKVIEEAQQARRSCQAAIEALRLADEQIKREREARRSLPPTPSLWQQLIAAQDAVFADLEYAREILGCAEQGVEWSIRSLGDSAVKLGSGYSFFHEAIRLQLDRCRNGARPASSSEERMVRAISAHLLLWR